MKEGLDMKDFDSVPDVSNIHLVFQSLNIGNNLGIVDTLDLRGKQIVGERARVCCDGRMRKG